MLVREDAADRGEDDEDKHDDSESEAKRFACNVSW